MASTYKHILDYVAKSATTNAHIRLSEPVIGIQAPERSPSTNHQVTVTTTQGTYDFDEVVVTCPLGWLKQNPLVFQPALPARLQQAIDSISYGRLEKIYVTFPRAFWHHQDSSSTKSTVSAQFLEPSYAKHPQHIEWYQECISLAALPAPHAHPTLLFYTYGESGAEIINSIHHLSPSSAEYNETLIRTLHPFYSRLPGYDAGSADCVPTAFLATQWQKDEYAGHGSYCNFQVGIAEADRDVEVLRSGHGIGPTRGLWFAGEHTAPFVALGTTTGAYWSGERVAKMICQEHGQGDVEGVKDDSLPSAGRL